MKHLVSTELYAYWNRLRGGRCAPERSDIDPAAIRTILASTFVLEVNGPPEARALPFRLSGTRLNALVLHELKGHSLLSLFEPGHRDAVSDLVDTVLDDQVAIVAGLRAAPAGIAPLDLEMLLLPLRHHGRTHARLLGALAACRLPSWLGLLPIENLTLVSFRTLDRGEGAGLSLVRASAAEQVSAAEQGSAAERTCPLPRRPGSPRARFTVHEGGR